MLTIRRTSKFVKQFKALKRSHVIDKNTEQKIEKVINILANGDLLDSSWSDHALLGQNALLENYILKMIYC
jgi:mRNA-degrading endonuclease YafQ of YafQ-DinJ toxin-antitoxin module